jgi:hypothetical protein
MNWILISKRLLIMSFYFTAIFLLGLLVCSCSNAQDSSDNQTDVKFETKDSVAHAFKLVDNRTDEEKALDALDDIQVSGGGKLYSTFPNISHQECKGTINNYEISNEEFEDALLELLEKNYHNMSINERTYLASVSSKAQEEYKVSVCGSTILDADATKNMGPPRNGTWIFPAILDQRDLIIIW